MRKFVTALLVFLLLCLPVWALAEEYSEGYFHYIEGEGCVIITGYFGTEKTVELPTHIAGLPVSEIAEGAFIGTTVEKLILPYTVMSVAEGAIAENIEVSFDEDGDGKGEQVEELVPALSEKQDGTAPDGSGTVTAPQPQVLDIETPNGESVTVTTVDSGNAAAAPEKGHGGTAAVIIIAVLAVAGAAYGIVRNNLKKGEKIV